MAGARRFEELEVWKKARQFTKATYKATSEGDLRHDFTLCDQMRRAAVSIASNIAEGFERGGNKEFRQFLALAKGSAGEIRSQLYNALDAGLLEQRQFQLLLDSASELSQMIAGLIRYLERSEYKGSKFKEASGPEYEVRDQVYNEDDPEV